MGTYERDRPIILYANLDDLEDVSKDRILGVEDSSRIIDVKVVISRPNGDRWGVLSASLENIEDFGKWYVTNLILDKTDEFGTYKIKWIFVLDNGEESTMEYPIEVFRTVITPYWTFQKTRKQRNKELQDLPEDIVDEIGEQNAN